MKFHPRPDKNKKPVAITHLHTPSPLSTWNDPHRIATVVPDGHMPESLHDVALVPWVDAPKDDAGWSRIAAGFQFEEPEFEPVA
ncbi:MAG TPA: hypothetical protein PLC09_11085 [Holophaga sp.]|nr:hypothetical protein [Holophaga sp.]